MKEQQVVALYGNSLFLAGVETSLRDRPEFDVVRIDATLVNAEPNLQSLCPNVIIFDRGDARLDTWSDMTQLFKVSPGVIIIGLDLASNEVTVLSSKSHSATRVEDLVEAIRMETGRGASLGSIGSSDTGERG